MNMIEKQKMVNIIVSIVAILIVAVIGSIFVNIGMPWFESLVKPSQWIPSFVIPIVWIIVYLTFASILFLWQKISNLPKNIIILLIINGFLNVLWCLVFFALNQLLLGNIVIVINLLFAITLIYQISKTEKVYSYILSIYPIWVCIATTLNLSLWILN